MAIHIPGISKITPRTFTPYRDGVYLMQVTGISSAPSQRSPGTTYKVQFEILEGPPQQDGTEPVGRTFTWNNFVMAPEHPSYHTETRNGGLIGEIGLTRLVEFLKAAGVEIDDDDAFEPEDAIEATVFAKLSISTDKEDDTVQRNEVDNFRPYKG
jgi:hypothetical protein